NTSAQAVSGTQMDLFGNAAGAATDVLSPGPEYAPPTAGKNVHNTPHNYVLADSPELQQELAALLAKQRSFCFDTETTGTDANTADLVGLSFAIEPGKAWYVPTPCEKEGCLDVLAHFKPILEDGSIEKVGQNVKYDSLLLARYGGIVNGPLFDTMLAHYLIDPDTRHGMDMLAENYLGYTPIPITNLIGPKGKKQGNMQDVDLVAITEYAAEDADITLQLKAVFEPLLEQAEAAALARNVEFPLVHVLAEMERCGVKVDVPVLKQLSESLAADTSGLERTIYEKAGVRFNIASPKQLGEVLFEKLQLDPKAKKTKTGQYKTGEDILLALASKSDIVKDILEFRQLQKLKSTY